MRITNAKDAFTKDDLFYCYSSRLKKFLGNTKSIRHIAKGVNEKTNKRFWLFFRTTELIEALDEWSKRDKK